MTSTSESIDAQLLAYLREVRTSLFEQPVRLSDLRAKARGIEARLGPHWPRRVVLTEVVRIMSDYYPLPELIAMYRDRGAIYEEEVHSGSLDVTAYRHGLIDRVHALCRRWLDPYDRYPYGDVRLLRPIIGEVLIESAGWERSPYPEMSAQLGEWYEQLAPGGALYPSDEHLDYVAKFEAFAETIVWDNRGPEGLQEGLTIVNFPAPPNLAEPRDWHETHHIRRN